MLLRQGEWMKRVLPRMIGGMVMLLFVYVALRAMEREGAASFVAMYLGLSYWLGWTMDERDDSNG